MLIQVNVSAASTGISVNLASSRNFLPLLDSNDAALENKNPENMRSKPARPIPLWSTARMVFLSLKATWIYHTALRGL